MNATISMFYCALKMYKALLCAHLNMMNNNDEGEWQLPGSNFQMTYRMQRACTVLDLSKIKIN